MTPIIEVKNYSLKKGSFQLHQISLHIYKNEIFSIVGRTGSGKTLLLESIAGYYSGREGNILLNGTPILDIPLVERKIGFVYQDYGLFPHMTVLENISYGLKMHKKKKQEITNEVNRMADILSISSILSQYPGTLSGGEKQRTALARALVLNPQLLLLDEPFSALDPATKEIMYENIFNIHKQFGCAILFVTHDFSEAQRLSDRVGVMSRGHLKAVRSSDKLFDCYSENEVNQFLGIKKEEAK